MHTDNSEHYKKLFDISLDLLCVCNLEAEFLDINPAFSSTLGYAESAIQGRALLDFTYKEDTTLVRNELQRAQSCDETITFECRYLCKDGSQRLLSWNLTADLEQALIYASARDISKTLESENHFIQLMDALDKESIIAVTDAAGTIIEVNDKFCEISGYSKQELIGQNHRIVNSGRHPKSFFEDMWQTISSGKPWSGMIENRRKDGAHYFVQSIIAPVFSLNGDISNYIAIRFDSTRSVQTKIELERTLEILNETGSIAKVGGWELDVATGDLTWTDETFNILEVEKRKDRKPVLPEGLDLFTEESKPIIEQAVSRAIEFGEPYNLELEAQTAKGNVVWVYTNGKANYVDGKVVSLSGTIQDIHQRKLAEKKYEEERIKTIQNSKLASLGELAAGIAHEINNPLAHISAAAQLMNKFRDNAEKVAPLLGDVEKSCNRIARIVKSLKRFSRTSDKQEMATRNLSELVEEALILTHAKSVRDRVSIKTELPAKAHIYCNEVEIEQVIVNLINNAIDAVHADQEKWVAIKVHSDDDTITLKCIDSGKGIPEHIKKKLFDPFFTTKGVGKGTGLGLSITTGILKEHKAEFYLDEDNANTCFVIKFPIIGEKDPF